MKKLIFFTIFMVLTLSGCSKNVEPVESTEFILNTVANIRICDPENTEDPEELLNQTFDLCSDYEKIFSRTIEGSDISKINESKGEPVEVSEDTIDILKLAIEFSKLSDGMFDVTIAPASTLWDFQSDDPQVPSAEALAEAVKHIDYNNIEINCTTVTLKDPDSARDLGGIAKGYIADKAAEFLKENGVTSAVINLGGNVYVIGGKDEKTPFTVGVKDPSGQKTMLGTIEVRDKSVVTSGIYERCFEKDGKFYHHILDPKSGYPVENNLAGVTIISDQSVLGDVLSTTCFVLGEEKGMELIESMDNTEAIFVFKDGEMYFSSGFGKDINFEESK